jgi:hypothetical protein
LQRHLYFAFGILGVGWYRVDARWVLLAETAWSLPGAELHHVPDATQTLLCRSASCADDGIYLGPVIISMNWLFCYDDNVDYRCYMHSNVISVLMYCLPSFVLSPERDILAFWLVYNSGSSTHKLSRERGITCVSTLHYGSDWKLVSLYLLPS